MTINSARALSKALGVSHTRINALLKRGVISKGKGGFDLEEVRRELAASLDKRQPTKVGAEPEQVSELAEGQTLNDVRLVHEKLKAKLLELEIKKQQGELIEAADVRKTWTGHISAVKNLLLLLPAKLASKAANQSVEKVQVILDEGIQAALTELSDAA